MTDIVNTSHIDWEQGGTADLVLKDGARVELLSARPFPPGSRPRGHLRQGGEAVWFKVFGSCKEADGRFRVQGRLIDTTRALAAKLDQLVPPR